MGKWSLVSATPSIRDRNDVYGHYFAITFKLKYAASMMGSFTESPVLEWKETITMIERTAGTWWYAEFDQFGRLPDSPTFGAWTYRYVLAHTAVLNSAYDDQQPSRLYDNNGQRVPATAFKKASGSKDAAEQVRNYLKKNGGIMVVTVTDTPGINKPDDATTDKFRLLTFDCGLKGMSPRIKALQSLTVQGIAEAGWTRECSVGGVSRPFNTNGLTKVAAPADVTKVVGFTGGAHAGTFM